MRRRRPDHRDVAGGNSGARERRKEQQSAGRQTPRQALKQFRYLNIPSGDLQHPYLVRGRTKCGKPSCRCARGEKHGPYLFIRYESWDPESGEWRLRREFVPQRDVRRVQKWLRRRRAKEAFLRATLSFMRRYAR